MLAIARCWYSILVLTSLPLFCQETGRLRSLVERTKAEGKQTVKVPTPQPIYAFAYSLSDALRSQRAIRVTIEQKISAPDLRENHIETWYLARIIDNLSKDDLPMVANLPPEIGVPAALANRASESFVFVRELGGESQVEGITVKSQEEVELSVNKEYILFGRFADVAGHGSIRLFTLSMGKSGVFVVPPKSNVFSPFDPASSDKFVIDVLARSEASPENLRKIAVAP